MSNAPIKTIKLSRPVRHGDEEVAALELREPTRKEFLRIGDPIIFIPIGEDVGFSMRADLVHKYIVQLCAIPDSVAQQLSMADFREIQSALMPFFME